MWYEDKLLRYAVESLNENLHARLDFRETATAPFRHFPAVSVALSHVSLTKANTSDTLAYAQSLYFTFDIWDIWQGKYQISQIYAENGLIRVTANAKGAWNWDIWKKRKEDNKQEKQTNPLYLRLIQLKKTTLLYQNQLTQHQLTTFMPSADISFAYSDQAIQFRTQSQVELRKVKIGNYELRTPQTWHLDWAVRKTNEALIIEPSNLKIGSAEYEAKGNYQLASQQLDFELNSQRGTLTDLFQLLPKTLALDWEQYRSKGKIFFNAHLKGSVQQPDLDLHFGCSEAVFYYPKLDQQLDSVIVEGFWKKNKQQNTLIIKQIAGKTEKSFWQASAEYQQGATPHLSFTLSSQVDLEELSQWIPSDQLQEAQGQATINWQYAGNIADYQDFTKANGQIKLRNFAAKWAGTTISMGNAEGIFEDNKLKIKILQAQINHSLIRLNGEVRNLNVLFTQSFDQLETDLKLYFSYWNLNQDQPHKNEKSSESDGLPIRSLKGKHHLILQMDTLIYKQLPIYQLRSEIDWRNQIFRWENTHWATAKGNMQSNGKLDFSDTTRIEASIDVLIRNIQIQDFLVQTEGFGQQHLKAEQLNGLFSLDAQADLVLDENLSPDLQTLRAEVGLRLQNGQLKEYAPLKKMAQWLQDRDWDNLRLGDLENRLIIENQEITIPKMEVRTSAGNLFVWGRQNFDQQFEYHLQLPLRNLSAPPESLEPNEKGGANLFLKVTGKPDQFEIAFDKRETVRKMREDLRRKWENFKNWFRKKNKPSPLTPE